MPAPFLRWLAVSAAFTLVACHRDGVNTSATDDAGPPGERFVVRGGVDVDGAAVEFGVAGGRIVAPNGIPRGATVVNLGGRTVVPAFIDSHVQFSYYDVAAQLPRGASWRPSISRRRSAASRSRIRSPCAARARCSRRSAATRRKAGAHTPTEALSEETLSGFGERTLVSTLAAFGGSAAEGNLRALRERGARILYGTDFSASAARSERRICAASGSVRARCSARSRSAEAEDMGVLNAAETATGGADGAAFVEVAASLVGLRGVSGGRPPNKRATPAAKPATPSPSQCFRFAATERFVEGVIAKVPRVWAQS